MSEDISVDQTVARIDAVQERLAGLAEAESIRDELAQGPFDPVEQHHRDMAEEATNLARLRAKARDTAESRRVAEAALAEIVGGFDQGNDGPERVDWTAEHELLVLAILSKRIKERDTILRAVVGANYPDGRKEAFRSPLGGRLGSVWRTDPDHRWTVSDPAEMSRWLRAKERDDAFEVVWILHTPSGPVELRAEDELCQVLCDHAPHLLEVHERIKPSVIAEELALARARNWSPVAGIVRTKAGGTLTVRADKAGPAEVDRLVDLRLIDGAGRLMIETGGDHDDSDTRGGSHAGTDQPGQGEQA